MEEEIEYWKQRTAAAEGLLGFILKINGGSVTIPKSIVEDGFDEGASIDITTLDDGLVIDLVVGNVV